MLLASIWQIKWLNLDNELSPILYTNSCKKVVELVKKYSEVSAYHHELIKTRELVNGGLQAMRSYDANQRKIQTYYDRGAFAEKERQEAYAAMINS